MFIIYVYYYFKFRKLRPLDVYISNNNLLYILQGDILTRLTNFIGRKLAFFNVLVPIKATFSIHFIFKRKKFQIDNTSN